MIARIHTTVAPVRRLIHELMATVGAEHPQVNTIDNCLMSNRQKTKPLILGPSVSSDRCGEISIAVSIGGCVVYSEVNS